jgi:hypothetical protein
MFTMSSYSSCKAENGRGKLHFAELKSAERRLRGTGMKRGVSDAGTGGK